MGQSQHLQQLLVGNRILQINQGENIVLAIPASVCLTRDDFVEPLFSSSMSVLLFQCFQFLFLLSILPLPHIVQTNCSRDESAHGTRQCPPTPHFRNDYCPTLRPVLCSAWFFQWQHYAQHGAFPVKNNVQRFAGDSDSSILRQAAPTDRITSYRNIERNMDTINQHKNPKRHPPLLLLGIVLIPK